MEKGENRKEVRTRDGRNSTRPSLGGKLTALLLVVLICVMSVLEGWRFV